MLAYFRRITTKQVDGDEGASAVEYGLLVAAIAAIIILVVFALGTFVKGAFKDTCTASRSPTPSTRTAPPRTTATSRRFPDNRCSGLSDSGALGEPAPLEGGPSA